MSDKKQWKVPNAGKSALFKLFKKITTNKSYSYSIRSFPVRSELRSSFHLSATVFDLGPRRTAHKHVCVGCIQYHLHSIYVGKYLRKWTQLQYYKIGSEG